MTYRFLLCQLKILQILYNLVCSFHNLYYVDVSWGFLPFFFTFPAEWSLIPWPNSHSQHTRAIPVGMSVKAIPWALEIMPGKRMPLEVTMWPSTASMETREPYQTDCSIRPHGRVWPSDRANITRCLKHSILFREWLGMYGTCPKCMDIPNSDFRVACSCHNYGRAQRPLGGDYRIFANRCKLSVFTDVDSAT